MSDNNTCDALTQQRGSRCSRRAIWRLPNIIRGTGVGRDDWVCGRTVHLCEQHMRQWWRRRVLPLHHDGILQPYNKYGYGSIVLLEHVDWEAGAPVHVAPYWRHEPTEEQNDE